STCPPTTELYTLSLHDALPICLGEGLAMALSPDGRSALVLDATDRKRLRLLPIGPGRPRELRVNGLDYQWARFFPDGKELLALRSEEHTSELQSPYDLVCRLLL